MTPLVRATTLTLVAFASSAAQATSLVDRLFEHAKGAPAQLQALTPADRQTIVSLLPVTLALDGQIIDTTDGCRQNAQPELSVVDLRGNGQPAVVAIAGNTCTSGMTGASLYLIARIGSQWKRLLGVPAVEYRLLPKQVNGLPEIGLLGNARCIGVWQYDGAQYRHARNVDDRGALCSQ